MTYSIEATAAEHVIGSVDAVLAHANGAGEQEIADFCQLRLEPTRRALAMAMQLGLVSSQGGVYVSASPLARLMISATGPHRSAVFRILLESYEPFRLFCARLYMGEDPGLAAERVKSVFKIAEHRDDVKDTLISFGTYCQTIESQGAGLYRIPHEDKRRPDFLNSLALVSKTVDRTRSDLASALGPKAYAYLHDAQALEELSLAVSLLDNLADPRAVVVHTGNAVESFLVRVAADRGVNLGNASGINSKVNRLSQNRVLTSKHQAMLQFLGHIRNAADHGVDPDLNAQWSISARIAGQYVAVAISTFVSVLEAAANVYEI